VKLFLIGEIKAHKMTGSLRILRHSDMDDQIRQSKC